MNGEPNNLEDLKSHQCIVYSLLTTHNEWHFNGPSGRETIRVNGRFSVNNPRTIRQAVLSGQGIAVTPDWLIGDGVEKQEVKSILEQYTPTSLDINALYPARRFVPVKVSCFIDFIREKLAAD